MPNWCDNVLLVTGPDRAVAAFTAAVADTSADNPTALSLEKIQPTPAELLAETKSGSRDAESLARSEELRAKYGYADWFDYRVGVWETKWNVDAELTDEFTIGDVHAVRYRFSSAWSPPKGALRIASSQHPEVTLRLSWSEPGIGEAEHAVFSGGTEVSRVHVDVPSIVGEVVVDTCGVPVARLDGYIAASATLGDVTGDVAETVSSLLRAEAAYVPDPRVLVTCWSGTLEAQVPERLAQAENLRIAAGTADTVLVSLTGEALAHALVGDGLAAAWYEAQFDSWVRCDVWLPKVLSQRASALAAVAPTELLAAQIGVCFDLAPAEAATLAGETLASGVDAADATRLVAEVAAHDCPNPDDVVTILTGALLPTAAGVGLQGGPDTAAVGEDGDR